MITMALNRDAEVVQWTSETYGVPYWPANLAIGLHDDRNLIVGSVLFHYYNGSNVELSFYGKNILTRQLARILALICIRHFNVNRVSVRTLKKRKRFVRGLLKLGFKVEGVARKYYGPTDGESAVLLVMFRDGIERFAK